MTIDSQVVDNQVVDTENDNYKNQVVECCRYGELNQLLELFQNLNPKEIKRIISSNSLLFLCSANGHLLLLKYLLEFVDQEIINEPNKELSRPLHWAALNGQYECVVLLLQKGAKALLRNSMGLSAATLAEQQGHLECVKVLLESYDPEEEECSDSEGSDSEFDDQREMVFSHTDKEFNSN